MAGFAAFGELVRDVVGVANPQEQVGPGRRGESDLMDWVCAWLGERGLDHEADPYWGLHAVLTGPEGPGERPGILLGAHLDSDHLNVGDLHSLALDLASERILCPGEVGLDCKTGVAIALSVLERLRSGCAAMPGEWQVHVLFTTGEESGQKGAIRANLDQLFAGRVRHAIVIDRMTRGACAPEDCQGRAQRHAVTNYHDVELLDANAGNELREHLARGRARALGNGAEVVPLPEIESPNCADALELRGRWDAEVVAPRLKKRGKALEKALDAYNKATVELRRMMHAARPEQRVSSMFSPPRSARYELMAAVCKLVQPLTDDSLRFNCVNLSYDYDDWWPFCSLTELDYTARIVLGAVESCYWAGLGPAPTLAPKTCAVHLATSRRDVVALRVEEQQSVSCFVNGELTLACVKKICLEEEEGEEEKEKNAESNRLFVEGLPVSYEPPLNEKGRVKDASLDLAAFDALVLRKEALPALEAFRGLDILRRWRASRDWPSRAVLTLPILED